MRIVFLLIVVLFCIPLTVSATEPVGAEPDTVTTVKPNTFLTLAEVVGLNTLIWSFDRYIRDGGNDPGFRIGFNSWKENVKNGFEWDDNQFSTNQIAHPYHGSLFFNSARSNGLDFWESTPFVFLGSFLWEYFFEAHHPSFNDWVATGVGGIGLGETTWRISSLLLETEAGPPGFWNELGAFAVNPMRGFNRLFFPRADQDHFESRPDFLSTYLEYGLRTQGEGRIWDSATTRGYLHYGFRYGDAVSEDFEKPYDFFHFDIQMNFADSSFIGGMTASGMLARHEQSRSDAQQHMLAAFQNYEYYENSADKFGGQSIGGGLLSRWNLDGSFRLQTMAMTNVLILGATNSDYINSSGREYDYGPGLGLDLRAVLLYKNREFITLGHQGFWIHSLNGNEADHLISATAFGMRTPVSDRYDLGFLYILYLADRHYADYPTVHARYPEIRVNFRVNYF